MTKELNIKRFKMTRKELLLKKFPEQAQAALALRDPSKGKNKYLLWAAKQLKAGHDPADITSSLDFFHNNPDRFEVKDINKYKDLKTLEDLIKDMGLSKRKEKEKKKEDGSQKIFENEDFLCVRIDDKPAMITYGANTRWCTTMTDHHYYEDYVVEGNDFYVLIVKNKKILSSPKYAIVRRSLLEFQVFDAQDSRARRFSEQEEERLREVVQAIVVDKPPRNYIRRVCKDKTVSAPEVIEWLKTQSKVTKKFVESMRTDIMFVTKTPKELIEFFSSPWNDSYFKDLPYNLLLLMANELVGVNNKDKNHLKKKIISRLKNKDVALLAKDSSADVRVQVAFYANKELAKTMLTDRSLKVVKNAASKIDIDYLFNTFDNIKSVKKKKLLGEVIVNRISQEKVKKFVLSQPRDVIKSLMD